MVTFFCLFIFGTVGIETCFNAGKNESVERASERSNSGVNSFERQEGMGSGAKVERLTL